MFIVLLRFADGRAAAPDHLTAHQEWVQRGVRDGVFLLVGSIRPGVGGALLATRGSREDLDRRVAEDPFVIHGVVAAEVLEVEPHVTDPRLTFLAG